jgi:hypothetical protein
MIAVGQTRPSRAVGRMSGYPPKITVKADVPVRQLSAKTETHALQQTAALFDHFVGNRDRRILNARREIKRKTIAKRRRLHFAKAA